MANVGKIKSKKKLKQKVSLTGSLKRINRNAAGIDIGASEHYVAVPEDRDQQSVRKFGTFTTDLYELADWLTACGIQTVAMESTGVYWICLFQILEARGFQVKLVDARQTKNVTGRKTDMQDCQWIQTLHTYGLLSGAFRPENDICVLRAYLRHRDNLIRAAATHTNHIHKALSQMNLKLHNVISDVTGVTGMRIIRAILAGERDVNKLAEMRDWRIKSSTETIAKSLMGDYRDEHLFSLQHALELTDFYQEKIRQCDDRILAHLQSFEAKVDLQARPLPAARHKRRKPQANEPAHDLRPYLYLMSGTDLTKIPGIEANTAQILISEIGLNMNKWPSEKHFVSWLGLSPDNRKTGGKIISRKSRKVVNRAANILRIAALNLRTSQSALGAFYRRLNSRLDTPKVITATANKLARLVYRMLKFGEEFVDTGMNVYEEKYRARVVKSLQSRAASLGFDLTPKQEFVL